MGNDIALSAYSLMINDTSCAMQKNGQATFPRICGAVRVGLKHNRSLTLHQHMATIDSDSDDNAQVNSTRLVPEDKKGCHVGNEKRDRLLYCHQGHPSKYRALPRGSDIGN
jgi:hypothetical protein